MKISLAWLCANNPNGVSPHAPSSSTLRCVLLSPAGLAKWIVVLLYYYFFASLLFLITQVGNPLSFTHSVMQSVELKRKQKRSSFLMRKELPDGEGGGSVLVGIKWPAQPFAMLAPVGGKKTWRVVQGFETWAILRRVDFSIPLFLLRLMVYALLPTTSKQLWQWLRFGRVLGITLLPDPCSSFCLL